MTPLAAKPRSNHSRASFDSADKPLRSLTILIGVIVLALNLFFLTKNYYWDGVFFAQVIENANGINASLIHPTHLYDQLFVFLIYRAVTWIGIHARALTVFQVTNCILSAAAAVVFFRICVRVFQSIYVSIIATVLFAFSATWWKFSTDADAYILAVLLLLICFCLMLPEQKPRPFIVAIVHAAAMLIHQLSIFFFPVALVGILLQSPDESRKGRWLHALKYSVTVAGITLLTYYLTFRGVVGTSSLSRFIAWITYFSPEHGFTFSVWGNLVYSLRSQSRVLLGGRMAFIREFSSWPIYALAAIVLGLTLAFLVTTVRRFGELKAAVFSVAAGMRQFRNLLLLCVAWIVPYVIFLFFFIPQNVFYRLLYLPAPVLLVSAWLRAAESRPNHVRRYRAAFFAAAFFAANLTFFQYPYSQTRANPPLQLALRLNQAWPPGTMIYYVESNSDNSLVKYFNPATKWIEAKPQQIDQLLAQQSASGNGAWIDTTLIDRLEETNQGRQWLREHVIERSEYELVNSKYRIRFAEAKR